MERPVMEQPQWGPDDLRRLLTEKLEEIGQQGKVISTLSGYVAQLEAYVTHLEGERGIGPDGPTETPPAPETPTA